MSTDSRQKTCCCCQVLDVVEAAPRVLASRAIGDVDELFKAFSDRTRLRILHLLLRGEMCVGDLVTILQTTQPRASQHLASLRNAGLVLGRKAGLWTHYSLAPPQSPLHEKLLECLRLCSAEAPELQQDERRAAALKRHERCCP